jgi:hypothetical protein
MPSWRGQEQLHFRVDRPRGYRSSCFPMKRSVRISHFSVLATCPPVSPLVLMTVIPNMKCGVQRVALIAVDITLLS